MAHRSFFDSIDIPKLQDVGGYTSEALDALHVGLARTAPIQLTGKDAERSVALVVNRHLLELISRWRGLPKDTYSETNAGLHILGTAIDFIANNANDALDGFAKQPGL